MERSVTDDVTPRFKAEKPERSETANQRRGRINRQKGKRKQAAARRVFEDIEATRASIVDSRQTLGGTIRLIGGMTVCLYVFPPLLKEFDDEMNSDARIWHLMVRCQEGSFANSLF